MDRLLVILDLDETLVYGTETPLALAPDFVACERYHVYRRPHVSEFLAACRAEFELAVWTSSGREYAAHVVRALFGEPAPLAFCWAVERCTWHTNRRTLETHWLKDLSKVKRAGRDLARVVMVDDSPEKLARHYGNHVGVRAWLGEAGDDELPALLAFLRELAAVPDVRRIEKRAWRRRAHRD